MLLDLPPTTDPAPDPAPTAPARSRTWEVLLLVLTGALLVSVAYALGRAHAPGGPAVFWLGQALLLLPPAWRLLGRAAREAERTALLAGTAAAQSLVVLCYSPDRFRFPDELQHLRTAEDVLRTGHLFTPNSYLPVSPGFPGLEEVTTALVHLTGLPLFACGVLTVSVAHALLPVTVLLLLRQVTGDLRLASVGALVATTSPHSGFFSSLFVYGALALPFAVLALRPVVQGLQDGRRRAVLLALPPFLVVAVTHHVTALAALAIWAALLLGAAVSGTSRRSLARSAAGLLAAAAAAAGWTAWHAPSTSGYLSGPVGALLHRSSGPDLGPSTAATPPLAELLVTLGAAAATSALVVAGLVALSRRGAPRLLLAVAALGLAHPVVLAARVAVPGGAELTARALTFGLLLAALPVAVALLALERPGLRAAVPAALVALLLTGSVTAGLPPQWERLPGTHRVAAFQAGMDRQVTALTPWARDTLTPDALAACDLSTCSVLGSAGRQQLSGATSEVVDAWTTAQADAVLRDRGISTLVLDRRTAEQTPVLGTLYADDTQAGHRAGPVPLSHLTRFDRDPLLDRVYDSGDVRAYDTTRTWED